MGSKLQCSLCGKQVTCRASQVSSLGVHLLKSHPSQTITHFTFEDADTTDNFDIINSSESKVIENSNRKKRKRKMYKTTVETWKPGAALLECPVCGKSGTPLIRKQRNKVAQSSLGALCLLGCWPICFLPFILGGTNIMNLYCKSCGEFMGTYDRKTGIMQPPDEGASRVKAPVGNCGCNSQ